jgi:hypothetical protein
MTGVDKIATALMCSFRGVYGVFCAPIMRVEKNITGMGSMISINRSWSFLIR